MLAAENITKKFAGIHALDQVSMEFLPGQVTAIIGENGAGKSTLMKVLSGVYSAYEGQIRFKGEPVQFRDPRHAQQCGISIIHQELNLVPQLTITENIFLGRELVGRFGILDKAGMRSRTEELLGRLKLFVPPETRIADLKVGQQQVVEIAKALLDNSEVLIMDEPTSAISEHEVEVLMTIIDTLRAEGRAIVYISHKLNELFKIADRYVVMRDGKVTETGIMREVTSRDAIISKMTGREIQAIGKTDRSQSGETVLDVRDITLAGETVAAKNILNGVSFRVGRGEILGIYGLMGAGRTELLETIIGMHPNRSSGSVSINGQVLKAGSPAAAIASGVILVPEDRKRDGFIAGFDVKNNISLSAIDRISRFGTLSASKEASLAETYIRSLRIKTTSPAQQVTALSGGNQQKVVLARCLATEPDVLMLDEPTRGVDAGAKNEIYKVILELAAAGMALVVVSSELPEILALSDRILVLAEGSLTAQFPASEATEDKLISAAIPNSI